MNEHSKRFDKLKQYYDAGLWSEANLKMAVKKKWITQDEYDEIVGTETQSAWPTMG